MATEASAQASPASSRSTDIPAVGGSAGEAGMTEAEKMRQRILQRKAAGSFIGNTPPSSGQQVRLVACFKYVKS